MWLRWGGLGACALLSACTAPNDRSWWDDLASVSSSHESNQFNFEWQLVGDQNIAPHHIFSSSKQVWLQYLATEKPPMVTLVGSSAIQPLALRQQRSYWIVDSPAKALRFQQGNSIAWAYLNEASHLVQPEIELALKKTETQAVTSEPLSSIKEESLLMAHTPVLRTTDGIGAKAQQSLSSKPHVETVQTELIFRPANEPEAEAFSVEDIRVAPAKTNYVANISDQNLRQVLYRWAKQSNWVFEAEHWAVDIDLPITASFSVRSDFPEAVQALVASTHLSTHPLKACFYSNQVLRILRSVQPCAPKTLINAEVLS